MSIVSAPGRVWRRLASFALLWSVAIVPVAQAQAEVLASVTNSELGLRPPAVRRQVCRAVAHAALGPRSDSEDYARHPPAALGKCITNAMEGWVFREPDGGEMSVQCPFVFGADQK